VRQEAARGPRRPLPPALLEVEDHAVVCGLLLSQRRQDVGHIVLLGRDAVAQDIQLHVREPRVPHALELDDHLHLRQEVLAVGLGLRLQDVIPQQELQDLAEVVPAVVPDLPQPIVIAAPAELVQHAGGDRVGSVAGEGLVERPEAVPQSQQNFRGDVVHVLLQLRDRKLLGVGRLPSGLAHLLHYILPLPAAARQDELQEVA